MSIEMELDQNSLAILTAAKNRVLQGASVDTIRVADIGCGEGRFLGALYAEGVRNLAGVGWTISVPPSALACEHIDLCQPGWSTAMGGRHYDWVVSTEVIEHLVNPFQYLSEIRKIIAEDGHLLLTFPNVHNLRSIIGYALGGRFSGFFGPNFNENHPLHDQHIFIPNLHLIGYFMKLTGFTIQETIPVNGRHRLTSQTTMLVARPCNPAPLP